MSYDIGKISVFYRNADLRGLHGLAVSILDLVEANLTVCSYIERLKERCVKNVQCIEFILGISYRKETDRLQIVVASAFAACDKDRKDIIIVLDKRLEIAVPGLFLGRNRSRINNSSSCFSRNRGTIGIRACGSSLRGMSAPEY